MKHKIIQISLVLSLAVIFIAGSVFLLSKPGNRLIFDKKKQDPESQLLSGNTAYDLALESARQWQADAKLAYMSTIKNAELGQRTGKGSAWELIFISGQLKNTGWKVTVEDFRVINAASVPYSTNTAKFPPDILSQEEAVSRIKGMEGFEDAEILGIDAIYGNAENAWYWGIKTTKGTVTIEAGKGVKD